MILKYLYFSAIQTDIANIYLRCFWNPHFFSQWYLLLDCILQILAYWKWHQISDTIAKKSGDFHKTCILIKNNIIIIVKTTFSWKSCESGESIIHLFSGFEIPNPNFRDVQDLENPQNIWKNPHFSACGKSNP